MPSPIRTMPSISLIVRWPHSAPAAMAQELMRSLAEDRLAATWAIEDPAQAEALISTSPRRTTVETALLIAAAANDKLADSIDRGLRAFNSTGQMVAAIYVGSSLPRGAFERRFCQAGIRAVVTDPVSSEMSAVRPLPFGLWELRAQVVAPTIRRWPRLLGGKPYKLADSIVEGPGVASIDLARVDSMGSRGWREIERLVQQAADACQRGAARTLTIAALAAELSAAIAARPQRSILRIAA